MTTLVSIIFLLIGAYIIYSLFIIDSRTQQSQNLNPIRIQINKWGIRVLMAGVVLYGLMIVPIHIMQSKRKLADKEIAPMCKEDGGIRVFESISLQRGQFATPREEDLSSKDHSRIILNDYVIKRRSDFWKLQDVSVYKYITWIERISDKKRLSEMIQYFREGDEVFHGKHCPDGITEKSLIDQTFIPQGNFNPAAPQPCQNNKPPSVEHLVTSKTLPPKILANVYPNETITWKRQYNCEDKMEFNSISKKASNGSIELSGTAILFDAEDGNRCQAIAMADPDRMVCSENAIWLIGRNSFSWKNDISIQKFSRNGNLIAEVILNDTAIPEANRIVGYNEKANEISIEYITYVGNKVDVLCHRLTASKTASPAIDLATDQIKMNELLSKWLPGCSGR